MNFGISIADEHYTLTYVILHPKEIARMFVNTIRSYGDEWLLMFLGNRMGWLNIRPPLFITLSYVFCLLVASCKKGEGFFNKKDCLLCYLMILLMIAIIFGGLLIAWVPFKNSVINGVYGRYFITSVLLLLLTVNFKFARFDDVVNKKLVMIVPLTNILFLSSLYAFIGQLY